MLEMNSPRALGAIPLVAFCGAPESGKSLAERILTDEFEAVAIDDKAELRARVQDFFGLTSWHVSTHEGKNTRIPCGGREVTVRWVMGEFGKLYEAEDPNYFARQALKELAHRRRQPGYGGALFALGSARGSQPAFYRSAGALVLELRREGCECVHDFDHFKPASHAVLDWSSPDDLRQQLITQVSPFLTEVARWAPPVSRSAEPEFLHQSGAPGPV